MILSRKLVKFEIDLDFVLLAITTSLRDYRICYLINKCLDFNFIKSDDLQVDVPPNSRQVFFSFYLYETADNVTKYFFIANKGTDGYLVPEMKEADYFLVIKNYIAESDLDNMLSALNRIPEIVAAVKIDPKKIKSRENLLF